MTVKEETPKLTTRQREGRAINAVAELLRRTLPVPNIYLAPPSSLIPVDVLAVDRGGSGDLHAVEIKLLERIPSSAGLTSDLSIARANWSAAVRKKERRGLMGKLHEQLTSIPAHFRYLAVPIESFDEIFESLTGIGLYAEDGIGRLGIITFSERGSDAPVAEVAFPPERFRVDPAKLKVIETKLLTKSRPDIEVRV